MRTNAACSRAVRAAILQVLTFSPFFFVRDLCSLLDHNYYAHFWLRGPNQDNHERFRLGLIFMQTVRS